MIYCALKQRTVYIIRYVKQSIIWDGNNNIYQLLINQTLVQSVLGSILALWSIIELTNMNDGWNENRKFQMENKSFY